MEITRFLVLLCTGVYNPVSLSRLRQFNIIMMNRTFWTEACANCQRNFTDLVTIYNQEEFNLLSNLRQPMSAWIGLYRTQPMLKWSNGDPVNLTLLPPPDGGYTLPNCAAIHQGNITWDNCTEHKSFMCFKKGTTKMSLLQENKTWYEAQTYCRQNYSDLVSIRNQEQEQEVKNSGMNSTSPYWIGLLYDDWAWADGGTSAYRNWRIYFPMNNGNVSYLIADAITGIFHVGHDNQCDFAICSKETFHLYTINTTWEQALKYCNQNHSELLHIESEKDQMVVEQRLRGHTVSDPVWLGLRQSRLFGFWVWTNGLPLKTEDWSNWEGGRQPELPLSQHCGAMETEEGDFKWTDQDCLSSLYFICEDSS